MELALSGPIPEDYRRYPDVGLRLNSGMDRPAVTQTYGSVWITCVLVWIGGMDRPVGLGYGSGLYILTCSHVSFEEAFDQTS